MSENNHQDTSPISEPHWSIQNADWRDYSQLNHLDRMCFQPEDLWPFWDLIGVLTLPGFIRLKAVVDERMVGFIGGERQPSMRRGWVTTLAVLPAYRRQGIAQALLEICEEHMGMPVVRLCVRASNLAAVQLYETAGYSLVDQWKKYYVGGETALVFEKQR